MTIVVAPKEFFILVFQVHVVEFGDNIDGNLAPWSHCYVINFTDDVGRYDFPVSLQVFPNLKNFHLIRRRNWTVLHEVCENVDKIFAAYGYSHCSATTFQFRFFCFVLFFNQKTVMRNRF
jgi:hypothetical protein